MPDPFRTAQTMSSSDFRLVEASQVMPTSEIRALLHGHLAALLVRDAMTPGECAELRQRFWNSPGRRPRPDGVAGYYVGAYHYGKSFDQYIEAVAATQADVAGLFDRLRSPIEVVLAAVRSAVEGTGIKVRPAIWGNHPAALARALAWTAEGSYLLAPHDDLGQLTDPRQEGFEIQKAVSAPVIAVNIYPHVPRAGGLLRLWNVIPANASREQLGIAHTGYPYAESLLADIPHLDVPVETGAVVLTNGGLIHGVTGYADACASGERLLINFFLGFADPTALVHWV